MLDIKQFVTDSSPFNQAMRGKQVVFEIQDTSGRQLHKLGPVTFLRSEVQKLSDMKNAPEKRTNEAGKLYTPPMLKLVFEHEATLVFVAEDTTMVAIFNGFRFILDKCTVSVVLYEHE